MRILIPAASRGGGWLGGVNYFLSLVEALRAHPVSTFGVTVLSNAPEIFGEPHGDSVEIVRAPWLSADRRADYFLNGAANNLLRYNPYLYRAAQRFGADLITHAIAGRDAPCPMLYWMADFQHRHLPAYFSAYERWRRDRNVAAAAETGHLLVSSNSAADDFRHFYPHLAQTQVHVLRFTPLSTHSIPPEAIAATLKKHHVEKPYFFVPNQFWRHKNHRIVVEALRRLPSNVQVIATGALSDSRGGEHIDELLQAIERYSLYTRFRMLGILPRQEMLALMSGSLCVINPSLMEGWSTVVEEGKHMGKRLILSDLAVHREQNPMDALFFDPANADQLAAAMLNVSAETDPAADRHRAERAHLAFAPAQRQFAEGYRHIAGIVGRKNNRA